MLNEFQKGLEEFQKRLEELQNGFARLHPELYYPAYPDNEKKCNLF